MKIFGVTGWKNSGKTGLVERLVAEFIHRGLSVSTVKHAHHTFDVDHPGRDSYRHRVAGAKEVLLVSKNRWAIMHELRDEDEPNLAEILTKIEKVDLVIIEGFKRDRHPKIEEGVSIYASSTILGNVQVGTNSIVAAGSLVLDNVAANSTVAGIPAKKIK